MKMQIVLWATLVAPAAIASPITFTISTTAGGTLGSTPYSDSTVTFTQVTDTSLIASCYSGSAFCAPLSTSNTVTIAGLGTYTITDQTQFFDSSMFADVGIFDGTLTANILSETATIFASYNLQSAQGPDFDPVVSDSLSPISTSGGTLSFDGNSLDATFTAVTSSTPEPGSFGLLAAGGVTLAAGLLRRRKFRA